MADFGETIVRLVQEGMDMDIRQAAILIHCAEEPNIVERQVGFIAGFLNVNKPAITRHVNALIEAGLVTKKHLPGDQRTAAVTLTKSGIKFLDALERPPVKRRAVKSLALGAP